MTLHYGLVATVTGKASKSSSSSADDGQTDSGGFREQGEEVRR